MPVKDHYGREFPLTTKGLYEPKNQIFRYWMPLIEFRKAYRKNDGKIRIFRVGREEALTVSFKKPGRTNSGSIFSEGRIGCCLFTRQEFFKIYRKAFNKTVTKARAAKAGA